MQEQLAELRHYSCWNPTLLTATGSRVAQRLELQPGLLGDDCRPLKEAELLQLSCVSGASSTPCVKSTATLARGGRLGGPGSKNPAPSAKSLELVTCKKENKTKLNKRKFTNELFGGFLEDHSFELLCWWLTG